MLKEPQDKEAKDYLKKIRFDELSEQGLLLAFAKVEELEKDLLKINNQFFIKS